MPLTTQERSRKSYQENKRKVLNRTRERDAFLRHGTDYGKLLLRLKTYKLPLMEYLAMLYFQGHRCAICRAVFSETQPGRWGPRDTRHIDHCHDTKKVRGIVCRSCNLLLGNANDNPIVLSNAVRYLKGQ